MSVIMITAVIVVIIIIIIIIIIINQLYTGYLLLCTWEKQRF